MAENPDVKVIIRRRVQRECENCGESAIYRNTYLASQSRTNIASSGYGKDDQTWCSDHDQFLCGSCHADNLWAGVPDNYEWCATFCGADGKFPHMFRRWEDEQGDELIEALEYLSDPSRYDDTVTRIAGAALARVRGDEEGAQ